MMPRTLSYHERGSRRSDRSSVCSNKSRSKQQLSILVNLYIRKVKEALT